MVDPVRPPTSKEAKTRDNLFRNEEVIMNRDIFGNLLDWGNVLQDLEELERSGKLNDHQEGLVRILRYRQNWQLREAALKAVRNLTSPSESIISEVLAILMDQNVYNEARILATDALCNLICSRRKQRPGNSYSPAERSVIEKMTDILRSPEVPIIHEALGRSLASIQ